MRKADIWFLVGAALILLAILMFWGVVRAAPSYSNVGQNLTYVGMNESIELRAKWIAKSTATYNDYFDVSARDRFGMCFNNNGTKLYVSGYSPSLTAAFIDQYTLSTPYDISTGGETIDCSLDVSSQDPAPEGIVFNEDGTKFYMAGSNYDKIYEYHLSTPFNISSASYYTSLNVSANCNNPRSLAFNDDGTKLFVVNDTRVCRYNLSTPYNISTATYDTYVSLSNQDTSCRGISFTDNGTAMYIVGTGNDKVYKYGLSTPYDITTASYLGISFEVSSQDTDPNDIAFNSNGTKLYIVGKANDMIYEYNFTTYKLDTAILYVNTTGSYQAVDTIDLGDSATLEWSNFSYTPTTCNKIIKWKITANDSSGTSNTTTIGTFYVMPYLYSGTGLDITTCTNKHNATITPSTTGDINATFLAPYFVRNATFKECSYEITEGADRVKITNASEYCNITVINLEAESGTSFYLQESAGLSAYPPPNLPSAIAAAGLIIIVIYTTTTRRR